MDEADAVAGGGSVNNIPLGVQAKDKQLARTAASKKQVSSAAAEQGIVMRKTRRGLVLESALTASRVRRSQGRVARGE
jgi:hypothetical protein